MYSFIHALPDGYFVLGDSGFGIEPRLMTTFDKSQVNYLPYERGQFNYQLSRALCKIEKVFGIGKKKFKYLASPAKLDWDKHIKIVNAILVLYNIAIDMNEIDTICYSYSEAEQFYVDNSSEALAFQKLVGVPNETHLRNSGNQVRQQLIDKYITGHLSTV